MNSKDNSKATKKKKKKKKEDNFLYHFVIITGAIPILIWLRPKKIWAGKKTSFKGGFVASANHCAFTDPIFAQCIFWRRTVYFLATETLFDTKLKDFFFKRIHCIKVDKANFSVDSFHEVVKYLKRDKVVSIFPEGRLNLDNDEILTFKSGIVLMAYTANKPIIPMYFVPPKAWYCSRTVVMGEPIDVREFCGARPRAEDFERVSEILRDKEKELQNFYYENYSKKNMKKFEDDVKTESEKEKVEQ